MAYFFAEAWPKGGKMRLPINDPTDPDAVAPESDLAPGVGVICCACSFAVAFISMFFSCAVTTD